jgi:hypothetical protein
MGLGIAFGHALAVNASGSIVLGGGVVIDLVILTEADDYMTTEDGFFLEFEL